MYKTLSPGSARAKPLDVTQATIAGLEADLAGAAGGDVDLIRNNLDAAKKGLRLSEYYEKTRALARRLTEWDLSQHGGKQQRFVCTGGGPGIMEAANRGASEVPGGKSIGLGISVPFEAGINPYCDKELGFEFHYFYA